MTLWQRNRRETVNGKSTPDNQTVCCCHDDDVVKRSVKADNVAQTGRASWSENVASQRKKVNWSRHAASREGRRCLQQKPQPIVLVFLFGSRRNVSFLCLDSRGLFQSTLRILGATRTLKTWLSQNAWSLLDDISVWKKTTKSSNPFHPLATECGQREQPSSAEHKKSKLKIKFILNSEPCEAACVCARARLCVCRLFK